MYRNTSCRTSCLFRDVINSCVSLVKEFTLSLCFACSQYEHEGSPHCWGGQAGAGWWPLCCDWAADDRRGQVANLANWKCWCVCCVGACGVCCVKVKLACLSFWLMQPCTYGCHIMVIAAWWGGAPSVGSTSLLTACGDIYGTHICMYVYTAPHWASCLLEK